MPKVIFQIKYEILPEKREDYMTIMKELKTLVAVKGLESYSVFEQKNKSNNFEELYIFENQEAYDEFDDNQSERVNILMGKLSDLIKENSTKYTVLAEVV